MGLTQLTQNLINLSVSPNTIYTVSDLANKMGVNRRNVYFIINICYSAGLLIKESGVGRRMILRWYSGVACNNLWSTSRIQYARNLKPSNTTLSLLTQEVLSLQWTGVKSVPEICEMLDSVTFRNERVYDILLVLHAFRLMEKKKNTYTCVQSIPMTLPSLRCQQESFKYTKTRRRNICNDDQIFDDQIFDDSYSPLFKRIKINNLSKVVF